MVQSICCGARTGFDQMLQFEHGVVGDQRAVPERRQHFPGQPVHVEHEAGSRSAEHLHQPYPGAVRVQTRRLVASEGRQRRRLHVQAQGGAGGPQLGHGVGRGRDVRDIDDAHAFLSQAIGGGPAIVGHDGRDELVGRGAAYRRLGRLDRGGNVLGRWEGGGRRQKALYGPYSGLRDDRCFGRGVRVSQGGRSRPAGTPTPAGSKGCPIAAGPRLLQ